MKGVTNTKKKTKFIASVSAVILVAVTLFVILPNAASAQPSNWPTTWTAIDTDDHGAQDGCPGGPGNGDNFRDVISTFYATDNDYLYLRMCTFGPAGWPSTDPQGEARL